jgi:hypothetical protein
MRAVFVALGLGLALACAPDAAREAAPTARAAAAAPLLTIDWAQVKAVGRLTAGELVAARDSVAAATVRLENPNDGPRTFKLITLDKPGITKASWVLTGRVRCTAVEGKGYLEMLHRFPNGTTYFARTMDRVGPQSMLQGTEPWRDFCLAFRAFKSSRPSQIVISVMLPRRGIVELGPLALSEGDAAVNKALGIE